jgi:hypothetical protein
MSYKTLEKVAKFELEKRPTAAPSGKYFVSNMTQIPQMWRCT